MNGSSNYIRASYREARIYVVRFPPNPYNCSCFVEAVCSYYNKFGCMLETLAKFRVPKIKVKISKIKTISRQPFY